MGDRKRWKEGEGGGAAATPSVLTVGCAFMQKKRENMQRTLERIAETAATGARRTGGGGALERVEGRGVRFIILDVDQPFDAQIAEQETEANTETEEAEETAETAAKGQRNGHQIAGAKRKGTAQTRPSEQQQLSCNVILHKLTDDLIHLHSLSRADCARRIARLEDYLARHPQCVLIDPLENVLPLLTRDVTCKTLLRVAQAHPSLFRPPRFAVLPHAEHAGSALRQALGSLSFNYPMICKPIAACGSSSSHTMAIVLNDEGLGKVSTPCVVQEYTNHDAVLYKVYVIDEHVAVYARPSIPNIAADMTRSIVFDSQREYPTSLEFYETATAAAAAAAAAPELASEAVPSADAGDHDTGNGSGHGNGAAGVPLTQLPGSATRGPKQRSDSFSAASEPVALFPLHRARAIARVLQDAFGLSLFGFDVIVSSITAEALVIDVNYFPSFKEVDDFPERLVKLLRNRAAAHRQQLAAADANVATMGEHGSEGAHAAAPTAAAAAEEEEQKEQQEAAEAAEEEAVSRNGTTAPTRTNGIHVPAMSAR